MFARSITLALAALATTATAQCTRNATVQAGNTCDIISQTYSVPTYQLALVNSPTVDAGCTNLLPGQELCLGWKGMDCSVVHMVVMDDTCSLIASKYDNLPLSTLYANNPQVDAESCNNLYVGQVLCVSPEQYTYPWIQLPSSGPNRNGNTDGAATAASSAWVAPSETVSSTPTAATTTAAAAATTDGNVEYCDENDQSADCVWEDELPYCDEQ
ncbi:hypothetical protein QFC19_003743 [Naganishia cerealis]|uniref:Uncharacterized protein n=1 Tax=Naganishia cerealis TaxID=610337 RepID=A0ACC2VZV9_9TREE|nr:hypothetical protein QFC19_003743 [Naganishia cerealis]